MIALLCSVPNEADQFTASVNPGDAVLAGSKVIFNGSISSQEFVLCAGGMGKANAAHAASLLLTKFNPEALIIFGVGGAYPASGAQVGDIALATVEIAGDDGVLTPQGFKDTEFIGIPLAKAHGEKFFNRFPASDALLKKARQALAGNNTAGRLVTGAFVTLSTCTGTSERAKELGARYQALCENMEGAAAAQVALLHGIPWIEVRGVSNIVEDRDIKKWDIPRAAQAAQQAVVRILEDWNQ